MTLVSTCHRRELFVREHPNAIHLSSVGCGRRQILDLAVDDYQQFAPMTLAGFDRAAKFLHGLGFVHPDDIAYPSQLLALASVLAIVGLPNDLGRTQLEPWWWSCAFGEVYNNWQNKRTRPPSLYLARLVGQHGISQKRLDEILRSHSLA